MNREVPVRFCEKLRVKFPRLTQPDQSGIAVATTMRQLERNFPNRLVPIIAITAQADEEMQETCLQAGMNACLMKPISQDQLGNVLHHWLQSTAPCAETEEK